MDQPVRHAGVLAVAGVIHQLEVVEEQVDVGADAVEDLPGGVAGGIERGVHFQPLCRRAAAPPERRAGPAARRPRRSPRRPTLRRKPGRARSRLHHLIHGHARRPARARRRRRPRCRPADDAFLAVGDDLAVAAVDRIQRAGGCTRRSHAARLPQHQLLLRRLRFGVVAPPAGERAAFKEHGGADARAIVQRKFADIENQSA
jgi:hypothetical protein